MPPVRNLKELIAQLADETQRQSYAGSFEFQRTSKQTIIIPVTWEKRSVASKERPDGSSYSARFEDVGIRAYAYAVPLADSSIRVEVKLPELDASIVMIRSPKGEWIKPTSRVTKAWT
jgi:hypothetical protein